MIWQDQPAMQSGSFKLLLTVQGEEYSLEVESGRVLSLGSAEDSDILLEGGAVLPQHGLLEPLSDGQFHISRAVPEATVSVNGVEVNETHATPPFVLSVAGETLLVNVGPGMEVRKSQGPPPLPGSAQRPLPPVPGNGSPESSTQREQPRNVMVPGAGVGPIIAVSVLVLILLVVIIITLTPKTKGFFVAAPYVEMQPLPESASTPDPLPAPAPKPAASQTEPVDPSQAALEAIKKQLADCFQDLDRAFEQFGNDKVVEALAPLVGEATNAGARFEDAALTARAQQWQQTLASCEKEAARIEDAVARAAALKAVSEARTSLREIYRVRSHAVRPPAEKPRAPISSRVTL